MYGIERRAALMRRNPTFAPARRRAPAVLAFPCVPPPPSVPLRYRHRAAALRLQRPPCAIQRCLLLPLTSVLPLFAVLPRLFSCPFPKDPALFLQTKIIVVLAIHLPTDSYPRHNLHVTELLEGSSTSLVPCPYHHVLVTASSAPKPASTKSLAAADRISESLCASLAPTCLGRAHRSPRNNDVVPRGTARLGHRQRCDSPASRS
ncbi:hypothetical protein K438DRAFT_1967402 [Mycena galopus ATCC 62051]|nr:hypothetical protein K438DRAFT_1967402 [Mycena galopus ATCC 62051]